MTTAPAPVRQYPVRDSLTMLRRNLKHMRRYPSVTLMLIGQPVVFLLLFVYVFGGALGDGSRTQYLGYVTPAIAVIAVASIALGTAISIAMDMTGGIISRFCTMAIARVSVLTGHVLGALIQTALAIVVVFAVAFAMGFDTSANVGEWFAVAGVLMLFGLALTWFSVALGLISNSVESASNLPMFLILMPMLGSGFVPADSMPGWLAWFARNQPFTPVMESVRNLLAGGALAHDVWLSVAWSVGITVVSYGWAKRTYARKQV